MQAHISEIQADVKKANEHAVNVSKHSPDYAAFQILFNESRGSNRINGYLLDVAKDFVNLWKKSG
jgi:hypothetical protein